MHAQDNRDQTLQEQQDLSCRELTGQIVHARKCNKRFFFLDVRVDEQLKVTVLFLSDDLREHLPQRLSDSELAAQWRKVRKGDMVSLQVFSASEEEVSRRDYPVCQSTDFVVLKSWPGDTPFPPEPARGFKQSPDAQPSTLKPEVGTDLGVDLVSVPESASWNDYCKFWINMSRCEKADCQKKHPTGEEFAKIQAMWVEKRTQVRKERAKMSEDPHAISSKVPHSRRALIFCQWLVNTFGRDYLNSGSGVLDIAGEPNARRDKPYQRRHLMDVIRKHLDIEAGGDGQVNRRPIVQSSSLEDLGGSDHINDDCAEEEHDQEAAKKERRRLKKLERDQFVVPRLNMLLNEQFEESHRDILEGASILIGMHPDQATEPTVDMALKYGKSFAVVPCCVFGHENPHRRLSNGGEVNTTLDLIQYLIEKDTAGTTRKEFLAFDGMNIVVFRMP
ncbi:hypothetical protein BGX31_003829 [Mortierella sp. GBA43]|nr:hypothetical protein BGX31_003829 [Mortierella sp. GBA43]